MRALVPLSLGYFMVILDATVVNVALPALGHGLHTGVSGLQWVVDAYTLLLAALLLAGGRLADRIGARRALVAGLALFTAASAACAAAPTTGWLVAARAVQGAGAAVVVPASLALIRATFPDARRRAHAVGLWGGVGGIGAAAGPVLGGALVSGLGWRAVFLVNVPVGAAAIALALLLVPGPPPRESRFDLAGQVAATIAAAAATAALIETGPLGWLDPRTLGLLALAAAAGACFVAIERRAVEPLLPLGLFRRRAFAVGNAVGLLINLAFYGELFVLSLYFQRTRGDSAALTGVALLPLASVVTLGSVLSGRWIARVGVRTTMAAGLAVGTAGFALLAPAGPSTAYGLLVAPLVLCGFGMSVTMPAATAAVIEAAPPEVAGVASGTVNAFRQVGGAVGVALLGSLGAFSAAGAVAAAAFALGAGATLAVGPRVQ